MGDTFLPHLVNGPLEDPVLYVAFRYKRRALLFDLGDIGDLGLRELHKISHIFVSHAHIDHFIGFDHWLRASLNQEEAVHLFGPHGIIENVGGKLAGYSWNLIQNYPLKIAVHEINGAEERTVVFRAAARFGPEGESLSPFDGTLLDEPSFTVRAAILDHQIPCLAFSLEEKKRLNIRQDRLEEMGLKSGPWLDELKKMVREGAPESTPLEIPATDGKKSVKTLKEWREELVLESEGQKIAYVVDCLYSPDNIAKIVALAQGAELFYCEASFAREDETRARERYHLTTGQAGALARAAQVKRFVPFHFSQRYEADPERLLKEAMAAFAGE